jgi:hypothetical protein
MPQISAAIVNYILKTIEVWDWKWQIKETL